MIEGVGHRRPQGQPARRADQGAPRRRRRRHRRQPDVAAVHHRARRRSAGAVAGGGDATRCGSPLGGLGPSPPAADPWPQRAARHGVDGGRLSVRRGRGRAGDGRTVRRPQTPFNASITAHRNVAFAGRSTSRTSRRSRTASGVKVNDVVMAPGVRGVAAVLIDRGELPDSSLVVGDGAGVDHRPDRPGRNQVSGMFSRLETQIRRSGRAAGGDAGPRRCGRNTAPRSAPPCCWDWSQFAGPAVFGVAMRVAPEVG